MELKAALRQQGSLLRESMGAAQRESESQGLFETLTASPLFSTADCLLIYVSLPAEPDTRRLISHALALGMPVAAPVITGSAMHFRLFDAHAMLVSGPKGILQPAAGTEPFLTPQTLCIVPGYWFDRQGYRIGYGGGYYDCFLSGFPGQSAGLCFSGFLTESLPREPWDSPVKFIVLPDELLSAGADPEQNNSHPSTKRKG